MLSGIWLTGSASHLIRITRGSVTFTSLFNLLCGETMSRYLDPLHLHLMDQLAAVQKRLDVVEAENIMICDRHSELSDRYHTHVRNLEIMLEDAESELNDLIVEGRNQVLERDNSERLLEENNRILLNHAERLEEWIRSTPYDNRRRPRFLARFLSRSYVQRRLDFENVHSDAEDLLLEREIPMIE